MIAAMMLFSGSSAFAQGPSTTTRNSPAMRTTSPAAMPMTSPAAVPGTIPTAGASPASPLGAIQLNLGSLGPIPGSTMGTIMTCPTTEIAVAAPSATVDASNAVGTTGVLSPQPPPGATPPAISSFGTSIMTGTCNPTASALDATEASGNSVASPIPGLATITGPLFSDATIPSAATEAGGAGLSPEIIVPTPDSSPSP